MVTTIGLDLAKNVFQVHGVDANGTAVVRQRLTHGRMLKFPSLRPWIETASDAAAVTSGVTITGLWKSPR